MNKVEENAFLREVSSDESYNAIELLEISREGKRLMDDAVDISEQITARNRLNIALPFHLKGVLGMTLGGMAGIWGVRSAWHAFQGGKNDHSAVKTGSISKNPPAKQTSSLPKPASLVMDRIPTNSSFLLDTTRLGHDSILENLLSQKLILDIHYSVPSERYYKKYIDVIFQEAISKATENSQSGLLDKKLFRSEVMRNFRYLLNFIGEGTVINSPGLCDLKRYSLSIYRILTKQIDESSNYYTNLKPFEGARNLSKEAIAASKMIDIDGICTELTVAVDSLIKEGACAEFSFAAKLILRYALLASSRIASLNLSNTMENLIFVNILDKLSHLNENFYRSAGFGGSWGKFNFNSIRNSLTFGSLPSRSTELYTHLLIVHATIIPDLIELRAHSVCKATDVTILNILLLDMKKATVRSVGKLVTNSSIATSEVIEQSRIQRVKYKLQNTTQRPPTTKEVKQETIVYKKLRDTNSTTTALPVNYKLPNTTQRSSTTKDVKQETTVHRKLRDNNSTTTALPVIKQEGAEADTDILLSAIAAMGQLGAVLSGGLLMQIEDLRKLIANVSTHDLPDLSEEQPSELDEEHMEDINLPGPSSRSDFRFPRISDELNTRISYTKDKFMEYVNAYHKNVDINRMEVYRKEYFKYRIDLYGILDRESYFVSEGLALELQQEQLNLRSAKMMVAEHLDFVNAAITKTKKLFDIILNKAPKNQRSAEIIMGYLVDYFKKTLNIQDDGLITKVLYRFNEVTTRSSDYLHTLARNRFRNIWFISTHGNVEQNAIVGDFVTNLDSSRIRSLPMFTTMYAGEVDDTIIIMFPEAAHGVNPEHPVPDFRYDSHHVGESLMHEITHASSATEDYMYFQATRNGRAKNAKEMMQEFYKNLKSKDITESLHHALSQYCKIYKKPIPKDLYAFFEENPKFKAYIIMNNAECYETFFRDISEVFPYDVDAWDALRYSKVSERNSLGQMEVLNEIGRKAGPIV